MIIVLIVIALLVGTATALLFLCVWATCFELLFLVLDFTTDLLVLMFWCL